jgi:ribosomal RNA-processing protein 9
VDVHVSEAEGAEGSARNPRWITCIASLPYSDLFASGEPFVCKPLWYCGCLHSLIPGDCSLKGSWDGSIRLWKVDPSLRSFSALRTLEAPGFVNSLQLIRPLAGSLPNATWLAGTATTLHSNRSATETNGAKPSRQGEARGKDIFLIAGVGREPRLGRWMTLKGDDNNQDQVRNGALVFALTRSISDATFGPAENADAGSP